MIFTALTLHISLAFSKHKKPNTVTRYFYKTFKLQAKLCR